MQSSSPDKPYLEFTVRASGSAWKAAFWQLREDSEVWIRGPGPHMALDETRPAVMLTGGVGVTPFKCMLEYAAASNIDTEVRR